MKMGPIPQTTAVPTLQSVLDNLTGDIALQGTRRRDLASAVRQFATLTGKPPAEIPVDLLVIRQTLDGMVPAQAGYRRSDGRTCAATLPPQLMHRACSRC
jgi:hypothetical protein